MKLGARGQEECEFAYGRELPVARLRLGPDGTPLRWYKAAVMRPDRS
jgi:hypothetical protein